MNVFEFQISQTAILKILLFGAALYFVLRVVQKAIHLPRVKKLLGFPLYRVFPFIEMAIWGFFLLWAAQQFFQHRPFYTAVWIGALALLLIWASWFAIRDVIAGIILKAEDAYEINQRIKLPSVEGKIRRLGHRSLEIETAEGQIVKIPYGRIAGEERILSDPRETGRSYAFQVSAPASMAPEQAAERLRRAALNSPWSSVTKEPRVRFLGEQEGRYRFEVVAYPLGEAYSRKVEEYVKKRMLSGKSD